MKNKFFTGSFTLSKCSKTQNFILTDKTSHVSERMVITFMVITFMIISLKNKSFKGEFCSFQSLLRHENLVGRTKRPVSAKGW